MNQDGCGPHVIVDCPMPYNGRGWTETCAQIINEFPEAGLETSVVLPRATRPFAQDIVVRSAFGALAGRLPWRSIQSHSERLQTRSFLRCLDLIDPREAVVYAWPGIPDEHVWAARERSIPVVRQMINCTMRKARDVLEHAYAARGIAPAHGISERDADVEAEQLRLYDAVLAPNPEVELSLLEAGVEPDRIVPTSFGWSPWRMGQAPARKADDEVVFLFVGRAGVRKGILDLLDAWDIAGRPGRLLVLGDAEPAATARLEEAVAAGVQHVAFTDDVAAIYRAADVLVMPTYEEGGPQVTLEAAGLGLPVVTTPMGAARLVEDRRNGMIVCAGDVVGLAEALCEIAGDTQLRGGLGSQARRDARKFTYTAVGHRHAAILRSIAKVHSSS